MSFGVMIIFLSTLQHTSRTVAATIMVESRKIFMEYYNRRISKGGRSETTAYDFITIIISFLNSGETVNKLYA